MIFAIFACAIVSGCCSTSTPRCLSLVTARVESLVSCSSCRGCSDCVPHRPFTNGYIDWWDYHVTEHTAQRCAFRALAEYRRLCGNPRSHHFKNGFITAYEDLALNRRPAPPVFPPPKYWNAFYRSCAGQKCVDEWFAGYDAGLAMGSNGGVSRFREVYLRREGCNFCGVQAGSNGIGFNSNTANLYDDRQSVETDSIPQQQFDATSLPSQVRASAMFGQAPNSYGR